MTRTKEELIRSEMAALQVDRVRAGLSQEGLARESGYTQSQVSDWESGNRVPRLDTYLVLKQAIDEYRERVSRG